MTACTQIPERFQVAFARIEALQRYERYLGAFIFGSLTRGEATAQSDLDAKVITEADSSCHAINHPVIGGVKLDASFLSFKQLETQTEREVAQGLRVPMLTESIVVFDKAGRLVKLKEHALRAQPRRLMDADIRHLHFLIHHADNKVRRSLDHDQSTALLVMHASLGELLNVHYRIRARWQVSDKRILKDLRAWDGELAELLTAFVACCRADDKFRLWSRMIDRILGPVGGRTPLPETSCPCDMCRQDLHG